jgi:PAS domain S-box-containing protein
MINQPQDINYLYSIILQNAEEGYLYIDKTLHIVDFNQSAGRLYAEGFNMQLERGKHIFIYRQFQSEDELEALYGRVMQGEVIRYNISVPDKDGNKQFFRLSYKAALNPGGDVIGVCIISKEITAELVANQELDDRNQAYASLFEHNFSAVFSLDLTGHFTSANNVMIHKAECTLEELLGHHYSVFVHPAYHEKTFQHFNLARQGISREYVIQVMTANGNILDVIIVNSPIMVNGEIVGVYCIANDITVEKQSKRALEKALLEHERMLEASTFERKNHEALINSTADFIWSVDRDLKLISANKAFLDVMEQVTGTQLTGGDELEFPDFFHADEWMNWKNFYLRALSGGDFKEEIYFPDKLGKADEWLEVSFSPIRNESEVLGVACFGRNITEDKIHEQALEKLNAELRERAGQLSASNQELEQFAYVASHDLQEPLRMVTGFLSQLEKRYGDQLDEKAKKYIWFAVDGAARMRQIINDLLEYSRYGRQDFQYEMLDTNQLVKDAMQLNRNVITETAARVEVKDLPNVYACKTPLMQVFHNLLSNALKYRKEGEQPVISISGTESDNAWIFSICDNGIGIEENYYEKIFIIFQRLHNKHDYSGTGIGLAICKKIIDNHKGSIWVESVPGEGSCFHFTIPFPAK